MRSYQLISAYHQHAVRASCWDRAWAPLFSAAFRIQQVTKKGWLFRPAQLDCFGQPCLEWINFGLERLRISFISPAMPIKPDPISRNVPASGAWLIPLAAVPYEQLSTQRISGPLINSAEKGH